VQQLAQIHTFTDLCLTLSTLGSSPPQSSRFSGSINPSPMPEWLLRRSIARSVLLQAQAHRSLHPARHGLHRSLYSVARRSMSSRAICCRGGSLSAWRGDLFRLPSRAISCGGCRSLKSLALRGETIFAVSHITVSWGLPKSLAFWRDDLCRRVPSPGSCRSPSPWHTILACWTSTCCESRIFSDLVCGDTELRTTKASMHGWLRCSDAQILPSPSKKLHKCIHACILSPARFCGAFFYSDYSGPRTNLFCSRTSQFRLVHWITPPRGAFPRLGWSVASHSFGLLTVLQHRVLGASERRTELPTRPSPSLSISRQTSLLPSDPGPGIPPALAP
jgi:hypothetical protein